MPPRSATYRSARKGRAWAYALGRLVRSGLTDAQAAAKMCEAGDHGAWTKSQVTHHRRHSLGLQAKSPSRRSLQFPSLADARSISSRVAVAHRGWGHLFTPCPFGSRPHVEKLSLAECAVLDRLAEVGPHGGAQVSSYAIRRLLRAGLVERCTVVGSLSLTIRPGYRLAKGVARKVPGERPTSIDLLLKRLAA